MWNCLKNDFELERTFCVGKICVYISVEKQDFEGRLLAHRVATLKEMFNLASEVLEDFNSLLEPKVTT